MKLTKWLIVPVALCSFSMVGCGPNDGTTVIESEVITEEERDAIDTDYDAQYAEEAEEYEKMEGE